MQLATYLNDHLSGAIAALELLEHMEQAHEILAPSLRKRRHDIELDRKELEALMGRLGQRGAPSGRLSRGLRRSSPD